MKTLINLYLSFLKLGTVSFGGGYAMLPLLQREIVDRREYATEEEIMDYYAIGQMTPGVIAVNVATFIGYKQKGILGSIIATLGMITSPIIIITLIALLISNFADIYYVKCALSGIRIAVLALIVKTIVTMAKKNIKNMFGIILAVLSFVVMLFDVSAVVVVVAAALSGILYKEAQKK